MKIPFLLIATLLAVAPATAALTLASPAAYLQVAATPEASKEFRAFVDGLKVRGVYTQEPQRVMLGDRVYRVGDVVHAELGIIFVSVDDGAHQIVFQDRSGAYYAKRY